MYRSNDIVGQSRSSWHMELTNQNYYLEATLCITHWYDDLIILRVLLRKLIIAWLTYATTPDHVYYHVTDTKC